MDVPDRQTCTHQFAPVESFWTCINCGQVEKDSFVVSDLLCCDTLVSSSVDFEKNCESFDEYNREPQPKVFDVYHETLVNFFCNANLPRPLTDKAYKLYMDTKNSLSQLPKSNYPLLMASAYKVPKKMQ